MSFWQRLRGTKERNAPLTPQQIQMSVLPWMGANAQSWLNWNPTERALRVPAVKACVDAIEGGVSMLPIRLTRTTDEGVERVEPMDDPLASHICEFWNNNLTAKQGVRQLVHNTLVCGISYVFIERRNNGRLVGLWPIHPSKIRQVSNGYLYNPTGFINYNEQLPPVGSQVFGPDELIILRYHPDTDANAPVGAVGLCDRAITLYLQMEESALGFFSNGGTQMGFKFTSDMANADKETIERAKEDLRAHLEKASRNKTPITINHLVEPIPLGTDPDKGQFTQQRTFQLQEICRVFNVPPAIIHDNSRSTYSNTEQAYSSFLTFGLQPWIERIESEMNLKLFHGTDRSRFRIHFDTREYLRSDVKSELDFWLSANRDGVMTPNEVRNRIGLPRSDQEGADTLTMQVQNQPLAEDDPEPEPQAEPPTEDEENENEE